MITQEELHKECNVAFKNGNKIKIEKFRLHVLGYIIQEIKSGNIDLEGFWRSFEGQKDSIEGKEYNALGKEFDSLLYDICYLKESDEEILSNVISLRKKLISNQN